MSRRQIAVGALVACVGGFAITKLSDAFDLGSGVAGAASICLIVGLLLIVQPRPPGHPRH